MPFIDIQELPALELQPGVRLRTPYGKNLMLSYLEIEEGATVPLHNHPHEQGGIVLEGKLKMTIGNQTRVCEAGSMFLVPPNVYHKAVAVGGDRCGRWTSSVRSGRTTPSCPTPMSATSTPRPAKPRFLSMPGIVGLSIHEGPRRYTKLEWKTSFHAHPVAGNDDPRSSADYCQSQGPAPVRKGETSC